MPKDLNGKALKSIGTYYADHRSEIDGLYGTYRTLDFVTGQETSRFYTRAKLIGMVGFVEGDKINRASKKRRR